MDGLADCSGETAISKPDMYRTTFLGHSRDKNDCGYRKSKTHDTVGQFPMSKIIIRVISSQPIHNSSNVSLCKLKNGRNYETG